MADPTPHTRHCQLVYTSFDDGAGRGGWQVKQVVGGLADGEADTLVGRVVTRFDLEPRLPDFPTEAQIAMRPSRLSYSPVGDHAAGEPPGAYWHTTSAGVDASGRPGNVVAHIVLDRTPATELTHPPIARWGSPDWLRPFGPDDVAAAELPEIAPQPAPDMSAAAAIMFLTSADVDRQDVFRVLVDAVVEALAGGPAVVLLTRSHADSASWIAAVSYFLPLAATHRFAWTTHDRPERVPADVDRGLHLIAVPAAAVAEGTAFTDVLVLDDAETPQLGEPGSTHVLARGEVRVSALSTFLEGILEDDEVARAVLARRDAIAAELGDPELAAVWPLAVAVTEQEALAEFHDDAMRVISHEAPMAAARVPWAAALVVAAQARHPLTPAEALANLRAAQSRHQDTLRPATRFLTAVCQDQSWLETGPITRVPGCPVVDLRPFQPVFDALAATYENALETHLVRASALVIRLTVLLHRLGRPDPGFTEATAALAKVWEQINVGLIWSRDRPQNLVDTNIPPAVRARHVRPAMRQWPRTRLATIHGDLWVWLFDDGSGAPPLTPPAHPSAADRSLYPIAVAAALATPSFGTPDLRRAAVTAAIGFVLTDPAIDDTRCRELTDELIARQRPAAANLVAWSTEAPHRTSPAMLHAPVFCEPGDQTLLHQIARTHPGTEDPALRALVAAARLRRGFAEPQTLPRTPGELINWVKACLADPTTWEYRLAGDLAVMLYGGVLVAQSEAVRMPGTSGPVPARLAPERPDAVDGLLPTLCTLVRCGLLDVSWVAGRSFAARFEFLRPDSVVADILDPPEPPWADRLLAWAIGNGEYRGPTSPAELRDAVWPIVRTSGATVAETFFGCYDDRAKDWLKSFKINRTESSGWGFNREDR
ncbi:MAG: hypothetical protein QM662_10050 [Gordonia sp. (in: high G+C Gram-positive bacteria)]